jgi:NDP-sugar pyrophosphorylase family protein
LIERYQLQAYEYDGLFIDIGIPEDYQKAQKLLAERYE